MGKNQVLKLQGVPSLLLFKESTGWWSFTAECLDEVVCLLLMFGQVKTHLFRLHSDSYSYELVDNNIGNNGGNTAPDNRHKNANALVLDQRLNQFVLHPRITKLFSRENTCEEFIART